LIGDTHDVVLHDADVQALERSIESGLAGIRHGRPGVGAADACGCARPFAADLSDRLPAMARYSAPRSRRGLRRIGAAHRPSACHKTGSAQTLFADAGSCGPRRPTAESTSRAALAAAGTAAAMKRAATRCDASSTKRFHRQPADFRDPAWPLPRRPRHQWVCDGKVYARVRWAALQWNDFRETDLVLAVRASQRRSPPAQAAGSAMPARRSAGNADQSRPTAGCAGMRSTSWRWHASGSRSSDPALAGNRRFTRACDSAHGNGRPSAPSSA
jgi:hypothetical protein